MSLSYTRVAIERDREWTELTETRGTDILRIQASDLREGQHQRAQLRSEAAERDGSADKVAVFLDLEIHIAADARTARREFAALDAPTVPGSIRYVGTPSGLAGLIADIRAADVGDGVTLLTHGDAEQQAALVRTGVVPWLAGRGTPFDSAVVADVLGTEDARTLAS